MRARLPRAGFFTYAALVVANLAVSAWQQHVFAVALAAQDWKSVDALETWLQYAYAGLSVAGIASLLAIGQSPHAARVRRLAIAAAVLEGALLLLSVGERVFLEGWSTRSTSHLATVTRLVSHVELLGYFAATALVVVACGRVAKAASARWLATASVVGLGLVGVRLAFLVVMWVLGDRAWKSPAFEVVDPCARYAASAMLVGLTVAAGLAVARVSPDVTAAEAASSDALSPAWGRIPGGIGLYLGACGARVLCALLGYVVMSGAAGAAESGSLRDVRDGIIAVAALSAGATVAMLAGVWRISRAPAESNGGGPALAAFAFMVLGLVTDLVSTSVTADALGGSVSAAFFAMDALPVIAFVSGVLGVGAAVSLLRAFGNIARALGDGALAARARGTTVLAAATGAVACLALLGIKHIPVELLVLLAVVALPLACATLVQFLRVAVPLGQTIRFRMAK